MADLFDKSAAATAAADVKTLVCIIKNQKKGLAQVQLVTWPEGTVVGKQDFVLSGAEFTSYSSERPGVVEAAWI